MSLIKQAQTTDKKSAARRRNGRKSRGAMTAAGKERIRAANLKHGYYSKIREEALIALGEDPAELAALMPDKKTADLSGLLLSPMPGLLVSIAVEEGDEVNEGEILAVVEAMKMQNVLRAARDGQIARIAVRPGASLAVDDIILEFA